MENMTLRELCDAIGVSRRAVQGYEKAGLASASGKNKYGHLLYNEKMQGRIEKILLFQQLGFTIKEVKDLIDAPDDVLKAAFEKQVKVLIQKREYMKTLIDKVNELIEKLL